jgi:hypothetical protein
VNLPSVLSLSGFLSVLWCSPLSLVVFLSRFCFVIRLSQGQTFPVTENLHPRPVVRCAAKPNCRACDTTSAPEFTAPPNATEVLIALLLGRKDLASRCLGLEHKPFQNAFRSCQHRLPLQRNKINRSNLNRNIFCKVFYQAFDRRPAATGLSWVTTKYVDASGLLFSFFDGMTSHASFIERGNSII